MSTIIHFNYYACQPLCMLTIIHVKYYSIAWHEQNAYCMFVFPRNLILLVKQTQIATFELYRMQYAYCMFR